MYLCWVEVEFVRGVTLADLCSYRSATWAQPVQAALSMPAAAACVVSLKVGQQVRCVVRMEDDRVSGTCRSQEPVSVRIADPRPAGKHRDGFVGRQERGSPWLGLQGIEPRMHRGRGPAVPVRSDVPVELWSDQGLGQLHSPGQRAVTGGTRKSGHTKF